MEPTWSSYLRDIDQVRAVTPTVARVEFRNDTDDDADGLGTMTGHFSVFDTWYEIDSLFEGRFLETIGRGAFTKTLGENRDDVKVLFNHGHDRVGDMVLGVPADLREDTVGAYYEVPLFDTSYNRDLLPGLRAGAYGSSFRFKVIKDEWNDEPERSSHNPDAIPERTIREVRLFEFGPVTFPANPAATAGVRSLTDRYYEQLRSRDPQRYEDLLARSREVRTPQSLGAADGTPDLVSRTPAEEPPSGHSERMSPEQLAQELRRRDLQARGVLP